ncbi:hypothetical protein C8J57DRAFT_1246853 [Mycena rebaudengoi]|nr:hypothetical protein C8J57DRAFT_1246853 [Mycena rebaudengoi]
MSYWELPVLSPEHARRRSKQKGICAANTQIIIESWFVAAVQVMCRTITTRRKHDAKNISGEDCALTAEAEAIVLKTSTKMMDTFHVGCALFEVPLEVEEGKVEPIEFFDGFCAEFDAKLRLNFDFLLISNDPENAHSEDSHIAINDSQFEGSRMLDSSEAVMSVMEGGITADPLKNDLQPTSVYSADVGASASRLTMEREKSEVQPSLDPVDPTSLPVPISAGPNVRANINDSDRDSYGETKV